MEDPANPIVIPTEVVPTQVGYNRWAEFYDAEDNPLMRLEERCLPPLLGDLNGLDVVDVGCGTGRNALRWATAGARVTAIDFSEGMLERARSKSGAETIRFVQHDLSNPLPFPDASFDRVLSCLVLEHIADLDGFFGELRRVCRPSGFVLLSAMHPAMFLRGVQARFIDPSSGRRIGPASHVQQVSDYLMAAVRAGLNLQHAGEHSVDASLSAQSPRAEKYLSWPMLLLLKFNVSPAD
jgi:malonyl-CoA O-methyltransferase